MDQPAWEGSNSSFRRWWVIQAIGWDGGLPVLVAVLPEVWSRLGVDGTIRDLLTLLFVPMGAGLVRAHFGPRQFERISSSRGAWWRHLLFGLGICVLMVFEAYLGAFQVIGGPVPTLAYALALSLYLTYLALMLTAVCPSGRTPDE